HPPEHAVHCRGFARHREGPGLVDAPGRPGSHPAGATGPGPAMTARALVGVLAAAPLFGGRTPRAPSPAPPGPRAGAPPDPQQARAQPKSTAAQKTVDRGQVERLKKAMIPLLQVMDHPMSPSQVKVGIMDDPSINAANAGNGEFYVTTGLLQKANDDQL